MKLFNFVAVVFAVASSFVSAAEVEALKPVPEEVEIIKAQDIVHQLLEAEYKLNPKQDNIVMYSDNGIFAKFKDVKNYNICQKVGDEISKCQMDVAAMRNLKAAFLKFGKYAKAHGAKAVNSASTSDLHQELIKPQIIGE